jgi:hypothetical protein
MFDVILWSVFDSLFLDPNPPVAVNTPNARLLSTRQGADVNLDPLPYLFIVDQE